MQFTLNQAPDVVNEHIDVTVVAGENQQIASVNTTLDSLSLAFDSLNPPEQQYQRSFSQVGIRTPGRSHTLLVTAQDQNGNSESASKTWID